MSRSRQYRDKQLAETTFLQFVSIFEAWFFDLLRLWLSAFPRNLTGRKIDFDIVLDATDREAIIDSVVERQVNEVMYTRPAGWFAYLNERVKLGCPDPVEIERVSEAKATRDVIVHNRGVASKSYVAKAGPRGRYAQGELIDLGQPYHRDTWALFLKIVADVSDATLLKTT